MSRRIDIELTSALDDGTWTWRAAGAKQPKGVLDGSVLPDDAKVGDELKVEVEQQIDGITVLSVVHGREKQQRADLLELLPTENDFKPVVETRARRAKGERRDRRPRSDRGDRADRGDRGDRGDRDDRREGRQRRERGGEGRPGRDRGGRGPSFTPPPEVPQRPKPKRLRPGKAHRKAVLDGLPEAQRPIAELALQGMPAVRQRIKEENERAVAEGRPAMPEATVMKIAEDLLPRLRVAEWLDRAEAAQRQMEHLDLRDLRSVVAAAGDPVVARDDSTGPLAEQLRAALVTKQDQELQLWYGDVDAALAVGRVVRALRLSSQPPKAGVPFPVDIARRLADSTNAALAPMDSPERWIAMLEAAAFSPVRAQIRPARRPDAVNDELLATVKRLAPALPQVAELFEVEVDPGAPMPKPLRTGPGKSRREAKKPAAKKPAAKKPAAKKQAKRKDAPQHQQKSPDEQAEPAPTGEAAPEMPVVPESEAAPSADEAAPDAPVVSETEAAPEVSEVEAASTAGEAAPEVPVTSQAEAASTAGEAAPEAPVTSQAEAAPTAHDEPAPDTDPRPHTEPAAESSGTDSA